MNPGIGFRHSAGRNQNVPNLSYASTGDIPFLTASRTSFSVDATSSASVAMDRATTTAPSTSATIASPGVTPTPPRTASTPPVEQFPSRDRLRRRRVSREHGKGILQHEGNVTDATTDDATAACRLEGRDRELADV
jgi:hypothetical protein